MKRLLMQTSLTLLFTLAASTALPTFATEAIILGPAHAQPGDLVILNAATSTQADSFTWRLIASEKSFLPIEDGRKIVFASGEAGAYTFVLAVAGNDDQGNAAVSLAVHTITIGDRPAPTPDDPKPTPDEPTPDGFRGEVTAAVRSLSASARKSASTVATVYDSVSAAAESDPASFAPSEMVAEVKSRLASELNLEQVAAWRTFWPQLAAAFVNLGLAPTDSAGHIEAFRTVANCLRESSPR